MLAGSYSFDGNADDNSGNNLNGTAVGATLTTDRDGNANSAFQFDGNDYIDIAGFESDFSFVHNTGVFTISAFIKIDDLNARNVIACTGNSSDHRSFTFMYETYGSGFGNHQLRLSIGRGVLNDFVLALGGEYTINDNNWHHVMAVGDGSEIKLHVDGVQDGSATPIPWFSSGDSTYPLRLGISYDQMGNPIAGFRGSLDEVNIFNRVVSVSEIESLGNGQQPEEVLITDRVPSSVNWYKYNGIERQLELDLMVDMATFRTLDPALGRWWQVDPKVDQFYSLTPYNSNFNSPIKYNDPEGDCPTCPSFKAGVVIGAFDAIKRTITWTCYWFCYR